VCIIVSAFLEGRTIVDCELHRLGSRRIRAAGSYHERGITGRTNIAVPEIRRDIFRRRGRRRFGTTGTILLMHTVKLHRTPKSKWAAAAGNVSFGFEHSVWNHERVDSFRAPWHCSAHPTHIDVSNGAVHHGMTRKCARGGIPQGGARR
jgi:hypothetical protein